MSTESIIMQLTSEAILITVLISLPAIVASLAIGLAIAIFSATTQIQEQTLSFAPKMIIIYLVLIATGSWAGRILIDFGVKCLRDIVAIVD